MHFYMQLRIIQIEHKQRELHDFEVENDIPEDCPVLFQERFFEHYLLTFLFDDVNVFLIQCDWRKQLDAHAVTPFQVICFVL